MKDSSVDWLGDIPLKWKTGRLSYQCQLIVDGTHHSPENFDEGEYLYISAKNIKEYGFDFSKITYITKQDHEEIYKRCPVRKNDVLYIKDGATAGVALVNSLNEEFSLLSSVGLIRPLAHFINPDFLCLYLNSKIFKENARSGLSGGAMTRFTIDGISRFTVVIPPISEQKEIIEYFQERQINFHKCSNTIKALIEKLKEYRASLISSAITGKIDVRIP
jgi:type I restriction enzyme S subunit